MFQATGDGTEPIKEEISGQNQLSHTNQMHILRWRPTVGSFRCYFQSLHKGLRGDYMYSWWAYRVLSSKDIWMMHWELALKKDSASVNCFISENGKEKKYGLIFFKKKNKPTHKAEQCMWVCVNAPLHTDTLSIITHIHVHTITSTHKQLCGISSLWLFPSWNSLFKSREPSSSGSETFPFCAANPDLTEGLKKLSLRTRGRLRCFLMASLSQFTSLFFLCDGNVHIHIKICIILAVNFILTSHICHWWPTEWEDTEITSQLVFYVNRIPWNLRVLPE